MLTGISYDVSRHHTLVWLTEMTVRSWGWSAKADSSDV